MQMMKDLNDMFLLSNVEAEIDELIKDLVAFASETKEPTLKQNINFTITIIESIDLCKEVEKVPMKYI
jgi:hypothetical protein